MARSSFMVTACFLVLGAPFMAFAGNVHIGDAQSKAKFDAISKENAKLKETCFNMASEVEAVELHSSKMKREGKGLLKTLELQKDKLKTMIRTYSLGQEFVNNAVKDALRPSDAMTFLEEFDQAEKQAKESRAFAMKVREVENFGHQQLLQISEGTTEAMPFQMRRLERAVARNQFLKEQEETLKSILTVAMKTEAQLTDVVKILRHKTRKLSGMLRAGRRFALLIGQPSEDSDLGEGQMFLLQTDSAITKGAKGSKRKSKAVKRFAAAGKPRKPATAPKQAPQDDFAFHTIAGGNADVFASVESEAGMLSDSLGEYQQSMEEWLSDLRVQCKKDVQESHSVNERLSIANSKAGEEARVLQAQVDDLHATALHLQEQVVRAQDDLRGLRENVTAGREYVQTVLAESAERLASSQELRAFAAMQRQDAERERNETVATKMAALMAISEKAIDSPKARAGQKPRGGRRAGQKKHGGKKAASKRGEVSLLQSSGTPDDDVLDDVEEKLRGLRRNGDYRRERLQRLCDDALADAQHAHTNLKSQQVDLEEQIRKNTNLKDRLEAAIDKLKENLDFLKTRHHCLAFFAKVMGSEVVKEKPEGTGIRRPGQLVELSLLQFSQRIDGKTGPGLHVAELQEKLASLEITNRRKQMKLKAEYAEALQKAEEDNIAAATENMNMYNRIKKMEELIQALKKQASSQAGGLEKWKSDWEEMGKTFSIMMEVGEQVLTNVKRVNYAPELSILNELDTKDRQSQALESARHRFDEILDTSHVSLLQVRETPRALLYALDAGIRDLEEQEARVEKDMKERFKEDIAAKRMRKEELQKEGRSLDHTLMQMEKLHARLVELVRHGSAVEDDLIEKAKSVRAYVGKLGSRALPASANATGAPVVEEITAPTTTAPAKNDDEDVFNTDIDSELAKVDAHVDETVQMVMRKPAHPKEEDVFNMDIDVGTKPSIPSESRQSSLLHEEAEPKPQPTASRTHGAESASDGKPWLAWFSR